MGCGKHGRGSRVQRLAETARVARGRGLHDTGRDLGRGLDGAWTDLAATLLHVGGNVLADEAHGRHDELRIEARHDDRGDAHQRGEERFRVVRIVLRHEADAGTHHDDQGAQRCGQEHADHGLRPFRRGGTRDLPTGHHDRQRRHAGQQDQADVACGEHARQGEDREEKHDVHDAADDQIVSAGGLDDRADEVRHDAVAERVGCADTVQRDGEDPVRDLSDDAVHGDHHADAHRGQRPCEHGHREAFDHVGDAAFGRGLQGADDA